MSRDSLSQFHCSSVYVSDIEIGKAAGIDKKIWRQLEGRYMSRSLARVESDFGGDSETLEHLDSSTDELREIIAKQRPTAPPTILISTENNSNLKDFNPQKFLQNSASSIENFESNSHTPKKTMLNPKLKDGGSNHKAGCGSNDQSIEKFQLANDQDDDVRISNFHGQDDGQKSHDKKRKRSINDGGLKQIEGLLGDKNSNLEGGSSIHRLNEEKSQDLNDYEKKHSKHKVSNYQTNDEGEEFMIEKCTQSKTFDGKGKEDNAGDEANLDSEIIGLAEKQTPKKEKKILLTEPLTLKILFYLIGTLNQVFPDYDFTDVSPTRFLHHPNLRIVIDSISQKLSLICNASLLTRLWDVVDTEIGIAECLVFSYAADPLSVLSKSTIESFGGSAIERGLGMPSEDEDDPFWGEGCM